MKYQKALGDPATKSGELYSINISKPILMKNTNLGIEVDFIIEFNQLKN